MDNPRCFDYDEDLHAFAVGCIRNEPGRVGEQGASSSSLKLLDDKTFDCMFFLPHWSPRSAYNSLSCIVLCQFTCQNDEEVTAVQMIPSPEGDTTICIGTVFHKFGEKEPSQGRLLLFKAELDTKLSSTKPQLKQLSELDVMGCVYALARVNGLLAAAIGPSVSYKIPASFMALH